MWGQREKVDVCRSGREVSPEPGRAGTLILNVQHPELWENKLLLSKPRSLFCCGLVMAPFSNSSHPYLWGLYFSPLLHPTPTPQGNSEQSLFFCIVFDIDFSCCLALLLREAAYLNMKGRVTKTESPWLYILSHVTPIYLLLESRRQAIDFPPPAVATFPRGYGFSWLAAQMRTRSQGDRRN